MGSAGNLTATAATQTNPQLVKRRTSEMAQYKIEMTFLEPLIGTVPKDKEIYTSFIASKAPEKSDDEVETVDQIEDKGWTGFHSDADGKPFLFDYAIKGFFKDACSMLKRCSTSRSTKIKAQKKIIDGLIFVSPRKIGIDLSGPLEVLERPLRAQTAQGERIALARSDIAPSGSKITITVNVLGGIVLADLKEWLDYGRLRGIGQWRNAGYGAFEYKIEEA
jgi:hypothetical protein